VGAEIQCDVGVGLEKGNREERQPVLVADGPYLDDGTPMDPAEDHVVRAYPETRSVGPRPSESLSARAAREREPRKPRDFVRG